MNLFPSENNGGGSNNGAFLGRVKGCHVCIDCMAVKLSSRAPFLFFIRDIHGGDSFTEIAACVSDESNLPYVSSI